ncbi:MAG: gephyrin-like molybdotransferase receptor GlpR [Gordonia sp. (in: high G+C Gram-positive bacteria)]|uniref:divisome protein SepX/GlpR n=1 Tax=Gordonia sp. (in: high G+C Gram-positive bacteria) TaxID=84139 RepID=UPI003BB78F8E
MNSSVLWIFLIVAWLFILLPMVLRGRPEVRKTTAAAANTRLLHRGGEPTAVRRRAAGRHPSNPDYVRKPATTATTLKRAALEETDVSKPKAAADTTDTEKVETGQLEIDIPEIASESAETQPAGTQSAEVADTEVTDVIDAIVDETDGETDELDDETDEEFEEFDELDDEAAEEDVAEEDVAEEDVVTASAPMSRERRGRGYASGEIAERDARRYRDRRRMVLGLSAATVLAIVTCFVWPPYGLILLGVMTALTGLYLFFLRRTAVAEQEFRAARATRLRRHAAEDSRLARQRSEQLIERPVAPGRRRPGGLVVLDFDDEDPAFDHLPTYDFAATGRAADGIDADYRRAV